MPSADGASPYDCDVLSTPDDKEYCKIDRFEACAVNVTCPVGSNTPCAPAAQLRLAAFANCLEATHGCENVSYAKPCAEHAGLDVVSISSCAVGASAAKVMDHIYRIGNQSDPVVTGFPDVRINGRTTPHAFPSFVEELERAICQAYSGKHPRACGPYLHPVLG